MFERFTKQARRAVVLARDEARMAHHHEIGPEHLLLGIMCDGDPVAAQAMSDLGLDTEGVRARMRALHVETAAGLDTEALAAIGIDADEVRRAVEDSFGAGALDRPARRRMGHIPFTKSAKKSLELALREAVHARHNSINAGHLLLGVLRCGDDRVAAVLGEVSPDALREAVLDRMTAEAA